MSKEEIKVVKPELAGQMVVNEYLRQRAKEWCE